MACFFWLSESTAQNNDNFWDIIQRGDQFYDSLAQIDPYLPDSFKVKHYTRKKFIWAHRVDESGDMDLTLEQMKEANEHKQSLMNGGGGQGSPLFSTIYPNWQEMGPNDIPLPGNVGSVYSRVQGVGRMWFIERHPTQAETYYSGSPTGGLWRSTNGGNSWTVVNTDFLPVVGVSHVQFDPNNPNRMFIVTGDGDVGFTVSDGVYYSDNQGGNWYNINGTFWNQTFRTHNLDFSGCETYVISRKMVFIPEDNTLVVATNKRLYKSSTISSTAAPQQIQNSITWTEKLTEEFSDIIRVPGTNTLIAGGKKLYISYDLGINWVLFTGYNNSDLPAFEGRLRHRMALRVSPDDNTKLYLAYTAYDEGQCFGNLQNIVFRYYRINLSNFQWTAWLAPFNQYDGGRYQAFEVNVTDSDHLFIGNVADPKQSLTGGTSFINLNKDFHDDMHWFKTFDCQNCAQPTGSMLWVGTDGGLAASENYGTTWAQKSTGLGVANVHGLSVLQRNFDNYFFGQYDHSNVLFDGVNHHFIRGFGDSFETQMVPIGEEVYLFSSTQFVYNKERVSLGLGQIQFANQNYSMNVAPGGWWGDIESNWKYPETLFFKHTNGVRRTTDLGGSFQTIFTNSGSQGAWELFSNPLHPNVLYVITTAPHNIFRTTNALDPNPSWDNLTSIYNLPALWYSDLAVDDKNPLNFWITRGTYAGYTHPQGQPPVLVDRVWYFDQGTQTLSVLSDASLAFANVGAIVHEYGSPNRVYIGTSSGVFYMDDNTSWEKMYGIPEVEIHDMEINYCTGKLVIGTFGRGVWQVDLIDDNNGVMEIATNTTWNTSHVVRHDLVVKAGRTLKIEGTNPNDPIEIRFATGKKLIVEPGATLEVEHTTLTNHCGDMWQGVEVWGNKNESQKPEHQGFVWLKEGAIIEHAAIGIATIKHTGNAVPNHVDWGKTGGIIKATNATFRNNTKDVEFLAYKNMNIFGIEKANVSFFKNCTFETNDQALYASNWNSKKAHVTMYRVHGVRYEGCTFQNLTTDNEYLASGIASFEASYTVDKYCLTNPCALYEESRFINLRRGIESYSVMNPSFPIRVQKAIFENNFGGIYLNTIPLASVLENEFQIPRIYVPNSLTQTAYGLYLDSCMYYRVEENYFEAEYNSPLPYNSSVGIICYRTAKNDEEIYHNTFVNLLVGIEAIGSNRDLSGDFGLEFRCNDFTNTRHDLYVANWNNSTNPGIRKDQGSAVPGQSSDLAGNLFSHLNNEAEVELEDFFHDVPPIINYNHHAASSNSRVVPGGYDVLDRSSNVINYEFNTLIYDTVKSCPSNLSDSISSPGTDETLIQFDHRQAVLMADAEFHIALYQSILDQLLDGGNTPLVNSEVDQVTLLTAWQLYAELLSMSPYVSEEIIQQLIAKEYDFPEALLRDILVLNVHTLSNNEIWHELDDRFNPLPEYMMNQVMAAAESGNTGADILRSYISHYNRQYYMALRRRLTNRLTDTTEVYGLDSAISLVANESSMYGIMMYGYLAHAADDHDLISDYQSKVTGYSPDDPWGVVMSNYFIWAEEYAASDSAFTLLGVNDWDQMAQQDEYSSPMANKALMYARMWGSESYEEPILIPLAESYKKTPRKVQKASVLELMPNPAKYYVTVYYRTDKIKEQKVLRLMDLNGKVLQIIPLKYSEDQVIFSLREYAVGTYIISLYANGKIQASEKLIIQK